MRLIRANAIFDRLGRGARVRMRMAAAVCDRDIKAGSVWTVDGGPLHETVQVVPSCAR